MPNIRELMSKNVHTCRVGDSLEGAARIMWERDVGCVPIVDADGHAVGMLTDRDACMAAYIQGKALSKIRVEAAMAQQLISCAPGDSLPTAEALMKKHQVRRLPVIEGGCLIGMLSMNDLARAAESRKGADSVSAEEVESTLAAICRPRPPAAVAVA